MKGTIKMLNQEKWFGFITPEEGTGDVFFHVSKLIDRSIKFEDLKIGQVLEFVVEPWKEKDKQQAVGVKLAD